MVYKYEKLGEELTVYSRQTRKKLYNKGMERRFFHGVQV
nr:MAG TPA: hypothetical protein [Caudoviricetes sp.]